MGGRTNKRLVLRIRFKDDLGAKSKLIFAGASTKRRAKINGRVVRVNKVSQDELFHTGEHNQMVRQLEKEFNCRHVKEVI